MEDGKKRLFCCMESLWGVGHIVRTLRLLHVLSNEFACTLATGSDAIAEFPSLAIEAVSLPTLEFTADYTALVSVDGGSIEACLERRAERLLQSFLEARPDVLLVEMFPFGRHLLADELLVILEAAQSCDLPIFVSLRDIYVYPSNPAERIEYVNAIRSVLLEYRPTVLVHSDARIDSIGSAVPIELKHDSIAIHQTGYIGVQAFSGDKRTRGDNDRFVLCAIGGGRVGAQLLEELVLPKATEICSELKPKTKLKVRLGVNTPLVAREHAEGWNNATVTVEDFDGAFAFQPDANVCGLIVTGGYNSWMDILYYRVPTVVIPLDEEQSKRAKTLATFCPWVQVVAPDGRDSIEAAWRRSVETPIVPIDVRTNGAQDSLNCILSRVAMS